MSFCLALAATVSSLIVGCSAMQESRTIPTYPAGRSAGVPASDDAYCRSQATAAAEKTKNTNVAKEVSFTAVGALLGAAVGNAAEPRGYISSSYLRYGRCDPYRYYYISIFFKVLQLL
jgi:hypothetical protein